MKLNAASKRLCLCLAALTLAGNAMGGSDTFATATVIPSTWHQSPEVSLFAFTKEVGEPEIDSSSNAGKTAWWKWTAPENGLCTVDTRLVAELVPVVDSVIGVFTGTAVNALTEVASSDDAYPYVQSGYIGSAKCTFFAVQGTTYHIVVDGYDASEITTSANRVVLSLGFVPQRAMRKLAAGQNSSIAGFNYSVSFSKTSTFGFSARLKLGRSTYNFKGVFSPEGTFTSAIAWRNPANPTLVIPLGVLFEAKDGGTFYLWDGFEATSGATLVEVRSFPGTSTTPLAGQFTNNGSVIERVTISPKGSVTAAGRAFDGTPYTYAGPLCAFYNELAGHDSALPVMVSLHRGKGYLYHRLSFDEFGDSDRMEALSHYQRPANPTGTFYPGGINTGVSIGFHNKAYTRPAAGARALGFLNMTNGSGKLTMMAVMGELAANMEENLTFSTANLFSFTSNANKPVLKLNTRTGLVSGSVIDGAGKKRTLFGALSLDHSFTPRLSGWASGTTQNVRFHVN